MVLTRSQILQQCKEQQSTKSTPIKKKKKPSARVTEKIPTAVKNERIDIQKTIARCIVDKIIENS